MDGLKYPMQIGHGPDCKRLLVQRDPPNATQVGRAGSVLLTGFHVETDRDTQHPIQLSELSFEPAGSGTMIALKVDHVSRSGRLL
jgi:hypothetical protein